MRTGRWPWCTAGRRATPGGVNLRARLALTLGILSAVASGAVALAGHGVARGQMERQIDESLVSFYDGHKDNDGAAARDECERTKDRFTGEAVAAAPGGRRQGPGRGPDEAEEFDIAGAVMQCFDLDGVVQGSTALVPLDVTAYDLAVARGEAPSGQLRTVAAQEDGYRVMTMRVDGVGGLQVARSLEESESLLGLLRIRLALLALVATAGAVLTGWFVARHISRPVVGLAAVAEDIAASGRLDREIPVVPGRDETARLSRAFATMVDALRRSRDQQQQLVQDAGHELRTPLTSARTNIHTLRRHPDLPPEQREQILGDVDMELRELTALSNELVALAMDAGDDEPEQHVDLAEIASRAVERARRRSQRPFVTAFTPSPVVGRPRQLRRAVDNLLDNANKFSPPDAPIEVTVADGRLQVRDHGPGIPPGDLPHVFDRFYRSTASRSLPGSGLGLAIVQATMDAHGGRATAANHPEGGAVLTLELPVRD